MHITEATVIMRAGVLSRCPSKLKASGDGSGYMNSPHFRMNSNYYLTVIDAHREYRQSSRVTYSVGAYRCDACAARTT